jgi:predicted trehalose synthase
MRVAAAGLDLPPTLLEVLPSQRWFAGKARRIAAIEARDVVPWALAEARFWLAEVRYADTGPTDTYLLVETSAGPESLGQPEVAEALLEHFRQRTTMPTARGGRLAFVPTSVLNGVDPARTRPAALVGAEQSNTSLRYGEALIFKLFRRLQLGGENPEVEIGRFLTERTGFRDSPAVVGSITYTGPDGGVASFGLLQEFVPNQGDAWRGTLRRLEPALAGQAVEAAVEPIRRLGQVTADLHLALASDASLPRFAPEPIHTHDVATWRTTLETEVRQALRQMRLDAQPLLARAAGMDGLIGSRKTRHHGDYHLGQVLERPDGGFTIIDFEGEPSRSLAARTEKRSPLRDVAGMLRSLDYARHAALRAAGQPIEPDRQRRADAWHLRARDAFLDGYLERLRPAAPDLVPSEATHFAAALSALELEKAAYEVVYELSHRPDWLPIPLAAFTQLP